MNQIFLPNNNQRNCISYIQFRSIDFLHQISNFSQQKMKSDKAPTRKITAPKIDTKGSDKLQNSYQINQMGSEFILDSSKNLLSSVPLTKFRAAKLTYSKESAICPLYLIFLHFIFSDQNFVRKADDCGILLIRFLILFGRK